MSNVVVILGAGASADFGVPTLRGVFKDVNAQAYLRADPILRPKLEQFFWQPRGHSLQTSEQSLTIEEMLTLLRDWELEPSLQTRPTRAEFEDFRRRLYVLIYYAVYSGKSSRGEHLNPLIEILGKKLTHVTWASFNWDCLFESSFYYRSGPPGPYGARRNPTLVVNLADWRQGCSHHEYLKLHGSVNWWMVNGTLTYLRFGSGGTLAQKWSDYSHGGDTTDFPVILEPSAYKYQDEVYKLLEPQWQRFFERLCEADCVLVVGYSLPDSDSQARSKILTAFQANNNCKWLAVDPSTDVCGRYRRLLGLPRLTVLETTLAGFNNDLRENLRLAFDNVDFSDPEPAAAAAGTPTGVIE